MWSHVVSLLALSGAGLAAVIVLWLVASIIRKHPVVGLALVFAFAAIAWELPSPSLGSVGGGQIKPEDLVSVALLLATVMNGRQLRANLGAHGALLTAAGFAIFLSIGYGATQFGNAAFNEARIFVWLAITATWLISVDWRSRQRQLDRAVGAGGIILLVVLAVHAAQYGLGAADTFVTTADGGSRTNRPLVSGQAMLLGSAGLYWVARSGRATSAKAFSFGLLLLAGSALCQHRSVWVALIVATVIYLCTLRGRALLSAAGISACVGLLFVLATASTPLLADFGGSFEYSLSNTGTLTAREGSFDVLLAKSVEEGPSTVLFGSPFGSGWNHVVDGQLITFGPHNWYLMAYLRVGLVGLSVLVGVLASALVRLVRIREVRFVLVLVAILSYSFFYATEWYLALPIGLSIAFSLPTRSETQNRTPAGLRRLTPMLDSRIHSNPGESS